METSVYQNRYPIYIILLASLQSLGIYFIALFILYRLYVWLSIPMLLYILFLEFDFCETAVLNATITEKSVLSEKVKLVRYFSKKEKLPS